MFGFFNRAPKAPTEEDIRKSAEEKLAKQKAVEDQVIDATIEAVREGRDFEMVSKEPDYRIDVPPTPSDEISYNREEAADFLKQARSGAEEEHQKVDGWNTQAALSSDDRRVADREDRREAA